MAIPLTQQAYKKEILTIVRDARAECGDDRDAIEDYFLEWVMNCDLTNDLNKSYCVLLHSSNDAIFMDTTSGQELGELAENQGWAGVVKNAAKNALYTDALEELDKQLPSRQA